MIHLLLIATALAAPANYKKTKEAEGCTLYLAPAIGTDVPMYAECTWPEVKFEKIDALLSKWDAHDDYFGSVEVSETVRVDGDRTLSRQVHVSSGIANREVLLWMKKEPVANGGFKYSWTKASDPLKLTDGYVEAAKDDGHWEVTPNPAGGVDVKYWLVYDPGGSVPGFLVRMFQTGGLHQIVTDMRTWANK